MATPLAEKLTTQFYAWEELGRGWHLYAEPVEPEPPFYPFLYHLPPAPVMVPDDGVRHTLFSAAVAKVKGMFKKPAPVAEVEEEQQIEPVYLECNDPLIVYSVTMPKEEKVEMAGAEQLLTMLGYTTYPVSFEITADSGSIVFQIVCRQADAPHVFAQVKAYFPNCSVQHDADRLDGIFRSGGYVSVIDYGLAEEFMRPLAMPKQLDPDPLIGICAALETLGRGEHAAVQILFQGAKNPWAQSILRSVTDSEGEDFFLDAPDMLPLAKEKVSSPLFGVTIKVAGESQSENLSAAIAERIGNAVGRIFLAKSNHLIPLDEYEIEQMADDMLLRESCRQGMLLNTRELSVIVHLPSASVMSERLERGNRKTKAAPESTHGHKLVLGINEYQGNEQVVSVSTTQRLKHTHIIGATGTGKSTLLESLIVQDMQHGNGLCIIDPHGDLIESILSRIPPERLEDVIVIDPADAEYPVGFNILSAHSDAEKEILASDLVAVFKRLSMSWGDQMNSVFANAILAFLESSEGGTLADLRRFLVEKSYRDAYLKAVSDPGIVYYWQKEFPLLKSGSIGPILTRLDMFLRPRLIRNMVAQKKSLDFGHILDTNKILLVKLSQGGIGEENSFLLGSFFVSKIYQAATARQAQRKEDRSPYYLYIDEFHNYITPSLSAILSGTRKYALGMVLAHQEMQQLMKYDTELASSVVANAGTRICYRLGDTDAKRFASGFSFFEAEDLENLNTGEAICRIERSTQDFSLTTLPLKELEEGPARLMQSAAISHSRKAYGTPREIVEESLVQAHAVIQEPLQEPQQAQTAPLQEPIPAAVPQPEPFAPVVVPNTTPPPKKPETQHRYMQTLIKRMAESRGYKATLEAMTPEGNGRVDVSLERAGKKVAVEISVTTNETWEAHNVEKCLAAGYELVIVCSDNAKHLQRIRAQIENKLPKDMLAKVLTLEPQDVIRFFDTQIVQEASTETVIKGYRVKVEYDTSTLAEMNQKQKKIVTAIVKSAKMIKR